MFKLLFRLMTKFNREITIFTIIIVGFFTILGYKHWFTLWSNPTHDDLLNPISKMLVAGMFFMSFMFYHICKMANLTKTSFLKALPKLLVIGTALGGLAGYLLTIEDSVLQVAYLLSLTILFSIFILIITPATFFEILRDKKR